MSEQFNNSDLNLAEFAKAISHPARVAILRQLAQQGTCICGEIVEVLPLAQSTVSQHLVELKKAGLVSGTVEGVKSCYCINWDAFENMTQDFLMLFKTIISQKNELEDCC